MGLLDNIRVLWGEKTLSYEDCAATDPNAEETRLHLFREVVRQFNRAEMRVWGFSMLPNILPGDRVEIVQCTPTQLKIGDVVFWYLGSSYFVHRIIALDSANNRFQTKGDSLDGPDPVCNIDQIVGIARQRIRYGHERKIAELKAIRKFTARLCATSSKFAKLLVVAERIVNSSKYIESY